MATLTLKQREDDSGEMISRLATDEAQCQAGKRFMSWRDLALTPLVESVILGVCGICTLGVHWNLYALDLFSGVMVFYGLVLFVTLLVLSLMRRFWTLKSGVYTESRHPWQVYRFNLQGFLCCANLGPFYLNGGVHIFLKKPLYQLLGATIGRNIMVISGNLEDPDFVHLEDNVLIGNEAVLSPHVLTVGTDCETQLILGKIKIKRGALVGARAMILPSVTVGENSVVGAMSLVPAFTTIPPNEIWSGVPAKKVGEVKRSKPQGAIA